MSDDAIKRARDKIRLWKHDSVAFVRENFKVEPDVWQVQALRAFDDPTTRRIGLKACAGPGKSAVLSWCGWKFLSCFGEPGDHPNAAAVSITRENLRDNLWKEMARWRDRSPFLMASFDINDDRISSVDHPKTWFMTARGFPRKANAEEMGRTLSGLHSKYILYLIDESGDQNESILKAAEQGLSTGPAFGKILQAGNPTSTTGMLHEVCTTHAAQWHIITITGDPDDPNRSTRIDIEWARQQIQEYGRENPWVMAYILGLFPPNSINTLLSSDEVDDAMKRSPREDEYSWSQKRLGVDAARFGSDPWVIFPRQGVASFTPDTMRGPRTENVVGRILKKKIEWGAGQKVLSFIDGTGGYGAGAVDGVRQASQTPDEYPIEVQYAGSPIDPRFFNKRSEILWLCAQWVKRGGALPPLPVLKKEMTAPTYWHEKGKLRVEEKEQIKKRLGFSPNHFDALANTFALPDAPRDLSDVFPGAPRNASRDLSGKDYDPFSEMAGKLADTEGKIPL